MNLGVVGCGRIGRLHTRNLTYHIPDARVLAVADINEAVAEETALEYGIPSVSRSHHALLRNPDIDAVVICSATTSHAQLIEDAALSGKHVFCEKPIDFSLARIDRALAAVEEAKVKLQIGFQRRFDPSFRKVRQLVEAGRLGDPLVLRITSRASDPPPIAYIKESGGLFLDMMIHDFDMARYLIGSEVEEVYATGAARVVPEIAEAGDIDTAVVTLKFKDGTLGTLDCCRKTGNGYDQRVEVFGSKGLARVENETPTRTSIATSGSIEEELPLSSFVERYRDAYVNEMREFISCILQDREPSITGRSGRMAVVIAYAAQESLQTNRPVKVDI